MKKVLCLVALAAGLIGVSAAQARTANPHAANSDGLRGMELARRVHHASGTASANGPLLYHNGGIMDSNTTYAIYWVPPGYSMEAGYSTLINQYCADVAADSGKTTNVYNAATQ